MRQLVVDLGHCRQQSREERVKEYSNGNVAHVSLSQELIGEIERMFLSDGTSDPNSELMQKICPPRRFPYDLTGKQPQRTEET
jgi:hypothetical protein